MAEQRSVAYRCSGKISFPHDIVPAARYWRVERPCCKSFGLAVRGANHQWFNGYFITQARKADPPQWRVKERLINPCVDFKGING